MRVIERACHCDRCNKDGPPLEGDCYKCWWWHNQWLRGLVVLPSERKNIPVTGPGAELAKLIEDIGVRPSASCQCERRAAQMNDWGVAGCRENHAVIIGWLKESFHELTLWNKVKLAAASLTASWLNPLRPFESLLDEAIRRAEAKA